MRFPVYPEKCRKLSLFKLKIRYLLLFLLAAGILMIIFGSNHKIDSLMVTGVLLATAGFLFFATFNATDSLIWVDIRDDGIHVLDAKGNSFRSTEYRYIRNIEIRSLQVTAISSDNTKYSDFPSGGIDVKLIMIYIDGALCSSSEK